METLPSGLPEHVADEEDLARFLTQHGQYTSAMVKPSAFLPSPNSRETSVSRHGVEPLERLWELGSVAAGNRNLHGAAVFKASSVRAATLEILACEPPPRHAAIRNWPWIENDPVEQKAKQKEMATLIACAAGKPVMRQTTIPHVSSRGFEKDHQSR